MTSDVMERIFGELRRPAIEAFIQEIESLPTAMEWREMNDVFDGVTHWHKHHAGRSGRPGRWREHLVPAQISMLESCLTAPRDWYDDDPSFSYRLTLAGR